MIDFNKIANQQSGRNYRVVRHAIMQAMKGTYGFGEDQWTLTDILKMERAMGRSVALQVLEGTDSKGIREFQIGALDVRFKLQVLTRQACHSDKDGTVFDVVNRDLEPGEAGICKHSGMPTVAVAWDEPAQPGDVVRIKRGALVSDPETGQVVTKERRLARLQQGLPNFHFEDYTVDEAGCITVPYALAVDLLATAGERIVFPRHRKPAYAIVDGRKTKTDRRQITNWHFREVPADFGGEAKAEAAAAPKTTKRGKKD